ncbi:selenoneine biosynthesis selenosugar synthase SenB [Rivibacter subsaxonicus]|uniref:Putative glycosyltransferase (TIGR04348 family) n=1 Tax=Rivibacter subsaxonicus TaxID=457575 RepID=A0A4Q7VPE5_9BURK|nr:selenoneine biosynthesis selenosugar synthase SenB [Rivibacter subsaxonicus]RZT98114.1 putative glycosyltransferase (TIGR04348 family) [Rivibacter subsaxonicus]
MARAQILIVSPALAEANNGNWQTASRWARMLSIHHDVRLAQQWQGEPADALIALHARKSAASVARWRDEAGSRPLVLVLTGTDLYGDIATDAAAQRSLQLADRLVVLQPLGVNALPPALRHKAVVCVQSTPARRTLPRTGRHLRAIAIGHLRAEKAPQTLFAAARRLTAREDIFIDHIGAALDPALGAAAAALAREQPRYRWLGAQPHGATRARLQRAHLLVHPSALEGGAHVVIEAVTSGTPVLASRIDGNVGLLGVDYGGYFEPGDDAALAALLCQCRDDPLKLDALRLQCARRAPLFEPARERATLLALIKDLLELSDERP